MKSTLITFCLFLATFYLATGQALPKLQSTPKTSPESNPPAKKNTVSKPAVTKQKAIDYTKYTKDELKNLADNGNKEARFELSYRYFQDGEYENAIESFRASFKEEYFSSDYKEMAGKSSFMISYCYYMGLGVQKDYAETLSWARLSSNYDYAPAIYRLGVLYNDGLGVTQSNSDADIYFKKAYTLLTAKAENKLDGWEDWTLGVMYDLGFYLTEDPGSAFEWYLKGANKNCVVAQYNLGNFYRDGRGVYQNYTEAFNWLSKAARSLFPLAENNLGLCYEKGFGTQVNYYMAFEYYMKAAKQGLPESQYNVGLYYEDGQGVTANKSEAIRWYRLAANKGNSSAIDALKRLNEW